MVEFRGGDSIECVVANGEQYQIAEARFQLKVDTIWFEDRRGGKSAGVGEWGSWGVGALSYSSFTSLTSYILPTALAAE
jgi:hypothetical protein